MNMLEACRHGQIQHLVYASSSSVYGANRKLPFSEHDGTDHPISLYAATKKANEMMAHSYASLFGLPATGLRFFTVYGPWGRPDMAVYKFTHAIAQGREIQVANAGDVWRDFTYVDDIVEGIVRLVDRAPQPDPAWNAESPDPATSAAPHRVYNIGNDSPEEREPPDRPDRGRAGEEGQPRGRAATARRRARDPRRRDATCAATWASRPRPR